MHSSPECRNIAPLMSKICRLWSHNAPCHNNPSQAPRPPFPYRRALATHLSAVFYYHPVLPALPPYRPACLTVAPYCRTLPLDPDAVSHHVPRSVINVR